MQRSRGAIVYGSRQPLAHSVRILVLSQGVSPILQLLRSGLRRLLLAPPKSRRGPRAGAPKARLRVEQLETRLAPANFNWLGAVSANWSNPNNWAGGPAGAVPNAGDTANFFGGAPNCTIDNGAAFGGTVGNLTISEYGGTITLDRNVTVSSQMTQNSGIVDLGGINDLTTLNCQLANGTTLIRNGGTFKVTNALSIYANATFSDVQVVDGPVVNSVTWSGGNISLNQRASFTNVAGAAFTIACSQSFFGGAAALAGPLTNDGSAVKSGSARTTANYTDLNKNGTQVSVVS